MTQTSPSPTPKDYLNQNRDQNGAPKSPPSAPLINPSPSPKKWWLDLSVNSKQLWYGLAPTLISLLGLGSFSGWLLQHQNQTNLLNQAKAELEMITDLGIENLDQTLTKIGNKGYTAIYNSSATEEISPKLAQLLQKAATGNVATTKANLQGKEQFLAAKAISPEQVLVRGVPSTPVNLNSIIGVTTLGLLLNLLMALLLRKTLTARIEKLNTLVKNRQNTALITGEDEIGELAQNFSQLSTEIATEKVDLELETERARILAEMLNNRNLNERELPNFLSNSLEEARAALDLDRLLIYHLNRQGSGHVAMEALAYGRESALEASIDDRCIPDNLIDAYQKGRVVAVNDTTKANFHPDHLALMESLQVKANLILPIISQGELFGLLIGHDCQSTHNWQVKCDSLKSGVLSN
jgi:hypothetical protein